MIGVARPAVSRGYAVRFDEPVVPTGDHDPGGESLHVPFEQARERLVEVVQIEHEPSIWAEEGAEVGEVRIAAQLQPDVRPHRCSPASV